MSGLIGGSGSTGSSLLRQILNRHSKMFCGPETSLFCKPALYNNWPTHKRHILSRGINGLKNHSFLVYRGTDLIMKELGLEEAEILQLANDSDTFVGFSKSLFDQILKGKDKTWWLEKTPSNAYSFDRFLKGFPEGKVIHQYRNPYDTLASLYNRGFSHYQAIVLYLLNTSYALIHRNDPRYYQLSYEDLVLSPNATIEQLCQFLNIYFEESMLKSNTKNYEDEPTQLKNWTYDESQRIGQKSVGKFDKMNEDDKEMILQGISKISISCSYAETHNLSFRTVEDLAAHLGYELRKPKTQKRYGTKLSIQRFKDVIRRTRKFSHYHLFNNPISFQ